MTEKSEHTSPVLVGLATTHASSIRTTSNTQSSSSRTVTTGTISSSSSSYSNTTVTSSSSSSKVLSTGARVGLGFGIVFFLLLSIVLFYYLKRRYQRIREKADYKPALSASEGGNPPHPHPHPHPNSQYPFSAPARPSSYYSPIYSIPYETSENATMMATSSVPAADSSSNSQPGRQLLASHAEIPRYQNELEQRKWKLDEAQEPHHPQPKYSF